MAENKPVEIIKGALLLERKGKAFYEQVAKQAKHEAVRRIFQMMAREEEQHVEVLTRQYVNLVHDGKLTEMHYESKPIESSQSILSAEIRQQISGADFEAAALSAALGLEERAVQYYSTQAAAAISPLEKELYQWLANWEKTHLKLLVEIDNELKESVWYDNQFWPVV